MSSEAVALPHSTKHGRDGARPSTRPFRQLFSSLLGLGSMTETDSEDEVEFVESQAMPVAPSTESFKGPKRTACGGLLERRPRWSLAPRGWLALLSGVAIGTLSLFYSAHPFLSVTHRVDAKYLVVEGWVPNYALEESIVEFRNKPYRILFTVGGDVLNGVNVEAGDNHATQAAKRLAWMGLNPALVQAVPSPARFRDRTYSSALALKEWLDRNDPSVTSFNLVSVGVHARRSRLLFQETFGDKVHVGIIAVEDREYDPKRWWQYSEGVKEVLSEGAGYLYARLFFHLDLTPANNSAPTQK